MSWLRRTSTEKDFLAKSRRCQAAMEIRAVGFGISREWLAETKGERQGDLEALRRLILWERAGQAAGQVATLQALLGLFKGFQRGELIVPAKKAFPSVLFPQVFPLYTLFLSNPSERQRRGQHNASGHLGPKLRTVPPKPGPSLPSNRFSFTRSLQGQCGAL